MSRRLPVLAASYSDQRSPRLADRHDRGARAEKARVLLIEDDEMTVETFTWALRAAYLDVSSARCGADALAALDDAHFDLVIVDLRLPDMSGLEVAKRLRERNIAVPFIIVSGFTTVPVAVEAMRLGASSVLEKPIDIHDLVSTVLSVVNQTALQRGGVSHAGHGGSSGSSRSTAERWAMFVLKAIDAPDDPKTLDDWARAVNVSRSVLSQCCRLVHVPAHDARDFARTLRALCRSGDVWRPEAVMDVADIRTLRKLLGRAGLTDVSHVPALEEFFQSQTWIPADNPGLTALRALLRGDSH